MISKKIRIDVLCVQKGIAPSRQKAQALILANHVLVDEIPIQKCGTLVFETANIRVKTNDHPYVSRGGVKLAAALKRFKISPKNKNCLDIGASTGGFTDCLLQNGAQQVIAVDVGYGQLAWKLRQNERVVPLERTNIRKLDQMAVPVPIDLITIDVSFISLKIVIPCAQKFMAKNGIILCLIKPQFEVGKGQVGKGGVVKDPKQRAQVIKDLVAHCTNSALKCYGVIPSPIFGPKGNKEFIMLLRNSF